MQLELKHTTQPERAIIFHNEFTANSFPVKRSQSFDARFSRKDASKPRVDHPRLQALTPGDLVFKHVKVNRSARADTRLHST